MVKMVPMAVTEKTVRPDVQALTVQLVQLVIRAAKVAPDSPVPQVYPACVVTVALAAGPVLTVLLASRGRLVQQATLAPLALTGSPVLPVP